MDIYERYAKLLVEYSLGLKVGDKVLIRSSWLAEELVGAVYKAALRAGAHPEFRIEFSGQERIFYENASDEQLKYISPLNKYAVENYDAYLYIEAPFNLKELQTIDAAKKQAVSVARTETNRVFLKRAAAGELKWSLCVFPTDASAQECGMSRKEYADFVYSACFLYEEDPVAAWRELGEKQQRIVDVLNGRKKIRFVGNDIDVSFSTEGRKWINSGGHNNMPSGEVFTTPVEDSVEGHIRFSYPGIFMGEEIEDIRLEVAGGEVVKWSAGKGQKLLDKIFEIEGARRFGEAAIGNNYGIKKFTRNMLFDEKIGGTIHMAIGASYPETGGLNESSVHWDMLADMSAGGRIFADGELVYENGKFVI